MASILSDINIQQIINFITVVDKQGFQSASEELHMTQSAISKSIGRLEETLGLQLFEIEEKGSRTFRSAKLTEQGRYLYKYWAPALNDIETAYKQLALTETSKRTLNIAYCSTTDPNKYFWPLITQLLENNKMFNVNVESNYRSDLIPRLADGTYDLVFVPDIECYSIDQNTMNYVYAAIDHSMIMMPRNHPLAGKSSLALEDIADALFLILVDERSSSNQKAVTQFFHQNNITPPTQLVRTNAFNVENKTIQRMGCALMDNFYAATNTTLFTRIPMRDFYSGIFCVWKKNSHKAKYIQELLNYIPDTTEIRKTLRPVIGTNVPPLTAK